MAATPEEMKKFAEVTATTIEEQAKFFLRAFVLDFKGNFEVVIDLAGEFAKFTPQTGTVRELDEQQAHLFMEKRGETVTVAKFRDWMKDVDLDRNRQLCFIEYCLYKYKKTITQLFAPPPPHEPRPSPEAMLALDEALDAYQSIVTYRNNNETRIAELEPIAKGGKVKGADAQKELDQIRGEMQIKLQRDMMKAKGAKKRAQLAMEESMKAYDPVKAEEERLAMLAKDKADAEAKKKAESKAKLAARAAMFGN